MRVHVLGKLKNGEKMRRCACHVSMEINKTLLHAQRTVSHMQSSVHTHTQRGKDYEGASCRKTGSDCIICPHTALYLI